MSGDREHNEIGGEITAEAAKIAEERKAAPSRRVQLMWADDVAFDGKLLARRDKNGLYVFNVYGGKDGDKGFSAEQTAALTIFCLKCLQHAGFLTEKIDFSNGRVIHDDRHWVDQAYDALCMVAEREDE